MPKRIKKKDPKKAVLYIRVSSTKQVVSGLGLEDQVLRCSAYCKMNGLEIVETYRDEGISAGKALNKRPAGARMIEALRQSDIGAVVILKLDRAFRSALDTLITVEGWEKSDTALHMVDFGGSTVDTSTPGGKMFLTMMAAFAEMERALISERTKAAMAVKRANGKRIGRVPYGKQLGSDGETLENSREELGILSMMRSMELGKMSVRQIADSLNVGGNFNRGDKRWTKSAVYRILTRDEG